MSEEFIIVIAIKLLFLVSSAFNHNPKTCLYSSALKSLNLQILMQWLRFSVRSLFLDRAQISFTLNDGSTSAVAGWINEPSKIMVVISL